MVAVGSDVHLGRSTGELVKGSLERGNNEKMQLQVGKENNGE